MENFNELNPAETERLALLSEELGETQQIIGKILRHGYESFHPDNPNVTNRDLLALEIGHVEYARKLLYVNDDIDGGKVIASIKSKGNSIKKYLHHQD